MSRRIRVVEDVTFSEIQLADQARTFIQLAKPRSIKLLPWHTAKMDAACEIENVPIQRACINGQEFEYAVMKGVKRKLWFIFDQLNSVNYENTQLRNLVRNFQDKLDGYRKQERLMRDANLMQRMYYLFTGKLP